MSKKLPNLIQFKERLFTFPNGDSYLGEFIADLEKKEIYRHGIGKYFKLNGQTFSGRWEMDVLVGFAEITFRNKCKYEGYLTSTPEYTGGTYTFGDGSDLRGEFNKNLSAGDKDIQFFDPNSTQWDKEIINGNKIILRYNWVKDEEEKGLCEEDEDSVSTPLCHSDPDTGEEC